MRTVSTSEMLDRHLKSFAESDLEGMRADCSSDAVLFVRIHTHWAYHQPKIAV